jgi:hypothetical protein
VDSNTLVVDDVNNRVGIGTASPGTILEVSSATPIFRISSSLNSSFHGIEFRNGGSLDAEIKQLPQTGEFRISNGRNSGWGGLITLYTDTAERMRITSAGNVGIGTTSPAYKLDVSGTARVTSTLIGGGRISAATEYRLNDNSYSRVAILDGAGAFAGGYNFNINGGTAQHDSTGAVAAYYYNSAGYISLYTNSSQAAGTAASERLRITSTGNVGIGTTSVSERLTVVSSGAGVSAARFTDANRADIVLSFPSTGVASIDSYQGTGDGTLAFRTAANERMRITSTGNVGIGTTSPQSKLQIGTTNFSITDRTSAVYGAAASETIFTVGISGVDYPQLLNFGVNQSGLYSTISARQFTVATENKLVLQPNGGNVGIGTTSPAYKLDVNGVGSFSNGFSGPSSETGYRLKFYDNGGVHNDVGIGLDGTAGGGEQMWFNALGGFYWGLGTGGTKMRLDSSGNVGIGTTSPAYKLDVAGAVRFSNELYVSGVWSTSYGPRNSGEPIKFVNWSATELVRINTTDGNVGIGTTSPGYKLDVNGAINSTTATTSGTGTLNLGTTVEPRIAGQITGTQSPSYSSTGKLGFSVTTWGVGSDYGLTEVMAIDMRGADSKAPTIWMNPFGGNVGIGLTSPNTKLHLFGSGDQAITIQSSTTASSASSFVKYIRATTGSARTWWTGVGIQGGTDDSLSFYDETAGAERMRISSTGNVGIGTSNPGYKLHVNGDTFFNGSSIVSGNGQVLTINGTNHAYYAWSIANTRKAYAGFGSSGSTTFELINENTGGFIIGTNGGQQIIITSAGNVGIGTTSPSSKLDVQLSSYDGITLSRAAQSGGSYIQARSYDTSNVFRTSARIALGAVAATNAANGFITFNTYSANTENECMRITSAGNVGIGTTSPNEKLTVLGSDATTFQGAGIYNSYTYGNADKAESRFNLGKLEGSTYQPMGAIGASPTDNTSSIDGYLSFYTRTSASVTEKMRITAGGNVGIGTTSPTVKLDVNGAQIIRSAAGFGTDSDQAALFLSNTSNYGLSGNFAGYSRNLIKSDGASLLTIGRRDTSLIGELSIESGSSGIIKLLAGGSERMRITSAGNVGIGTSSPQARLQVSSSTSDGLIVSTSANAEPFIALWRNSGNNGVGVLRLIDGGNIYFDNGATGAAQSTKMVLTAAGNVGIGTTSPSYKLHAVVASAANADIFQAAMSGISNGFSVQRVSSSFVYSMLDGGLGINNASPTQALHVTGNVRVTGAYYDSNNSAGSANNFLTSTGSGTDWQSQSDLGLVDGSGTANYVTKWSDSNTVTNSQIVDNGTNVGINNTSPKTKLDVNGTIGFGSKTMSMTDTFAAALTLNMNDHTGCYVKITAFGDWSNHSTIAYLGEFFVQASAGAYNEPGIIIRQVDNTGGGDDIQARILDPAGAGTRDFIIELKTTSSANTPFTAYIQYEVRGQYNSVS